MRIILLGAPGAGKGTLAALLGARHRVPWISTGDLFRRHVAIQTDLGRVAAQCMAGGGLVPDDVTCAMVAERLGRPDASTGFILDGFPRTCAQADMLTGLLDSSGKRLDRVVAVICPDSLIIERLRGRRVCGSCGRSCSIESRPPRQAGICDACLGSLVQRPDDQPDIVAARLATYREQTAPLMDHYRMQGLLVEIDNSGSPFTFSLESLTPPWREAR